MLPEVLHRLRQQRIAIHRRWEALLRIEPVNTPLALPDALCHLIPVSLEQIFEQLEKPGSRELTLQQARKIRVATCGCNRNPYLAHFKAGEQAVLETLVLLQTLLAKEQRRQEDLAEVVSVTRKLASAEIDSFCGLCTHHGESEGCRHYEATQ